MNIRQLLPAIALTCSATFALSPFALCQQEIKPQPGNTPEWRVLLEQATFARTYEGDADRSKQLFGRALAAAKASGDVTAEQVVKRQQNQQDPSQDPRAQRVIERLLDSVQQTPLAERQKKVGRIDWEFYAADTATVQWLTRCLAGPVWIAGKKIDLRPEDVFMIAAYLDYDRQIPVIASALASDDVFVRGLGVRACDRDEHRHLIVQALGDPNRMVRERACDRLREPKTTAEVAALLQAVELQTKSALGMVSAEPAFLGAMQKATPDSWVRRLLLEQQATITTGNWPPVDIDKVRLVLDWAEQAAGSADSARWIAFAADELWSGRRTDTYPTALAERTLQLALQQQDQFDAKQDREERTTLGSILARFGDMEDLERLAPLWLFDTKRGPGDCNKLFDLCARVAEGDTGKLVALGRELLSKLPADERASMATGRCHDYWVRLGRHQWTDNNIAALSLALETVATCRQDLRRTIYPRFVLGVRYRKVSEAIIATIETHLVKLVLGGLIDSKQRPAVADMLVDSGSAHAPRVALAVRNDWKTYHGEAYGDFLRRACQGSGNAARIAVVEAMRAGMTAPPKVLDGQQMMQTAWPRVVPMSSWSNGSNRLLPTPRVPQPSGQIVVKKEKTYSALPSMLCVLPVEQAAIAATELWRGDNCPVPRSELIETLMMARSVPLALDTLVAAYDEIQDTVTRARLLSVFGDLLHNPARKLIAHSMYSKQPLERHAALQAAQMLLAYDRARMELASSLPLEDQPDPSK